MSAIYIQVKQTTTIAHKLRRITFFSPDFTAIPDLFAGLHIKLFFKKENQPALTLPTKEKGRVRWPEPHLKPIARTYSIYHFDALKKELTVDFVLHDAAGPACDFARNAKIGDEIGFAGPGPVSLVNRQCEHFIFAADLSALPAISSVIDSFGAQPHLQVFLELEEPTSAAALIAEYLPNHAKNITITQQTFMPTNTLLDTVMSSITALKIEQTSITIAGEHESVVTLRDAVRQLGAPKDNVYAVPYWRHNQDEETYHQTRHNVMDS